MLAKPIDNSLKSHFQKIFDSALKEADQDFFENVACKIGEMDHFNKLKFTSEELENIDLIIDKNEYPFYINNHSSDNWLLTQFASRTYLLNVDESKQLYDCIYLGKFRSLLSDVQQELWRTAPAYGFKEFIEGRIDPYYEHFEKSYNHNEEDYFKISAWQSQNIIKLIEYTSGVIIKQIQTYCKTLKCPLDLIVQELNKIDNLFVHSALDGKEIKSMLSDLFIFKNFDTSVLNEKKLSENFKIYKSNIVNWRHIIPANLDPLIIKINQKKNEIICNEVSIFFIINHIGYWLNDVVKGSKIQKPYKEINWSNAYDDAIKDARIEIQLAKSEIENYVNTPDISKDEIKKYLIRNFELYRNKFNAFEYKHYFTLRRSEDENSVRMMFTTNSFFGHDLEDQKEAIKEANVIYSVSWEIAVIYSEIFDTHKIDFPDSDSSHTEIMSLMNQMVLDRELYEELNNILHDFMMHFHSYLLPIEIHFQNSRVAMAELFRKSLSRLQTILDDSEPSNKILYLQSRIKQLRQRELELKQFNDEVSFGNKAYRYSNLFKEFLEIEADFINETKVVQVYPALSSEMKLKLLNKPAPPDTDKITSDQIMQFKNDTPIAFSYIKYNSNLTAIRDMLDALIKNNFVSSDTELKEFRKILNNTMPTSPIIWKGNISELAYFIKLLHNDFKLIADLKGNVWKVTSNIFVDANGNAYDWKKFRGQKFPARAEKIEKCVSHLN